MKKGRPRFNFNLPLIERVWKFFPSDTVVERSSLILCFALSMVMAGLLTACFLAPKKKEATEMRLFIEATPDNTGRNAPITVGRQDPFVINVENQSFLDEASIKQAWVVDSMGGFQIMLQFDRRGTWLLEQYSVANRGRRIAIVANFGQRRWLGAPVVANPIKDGLLTFTPDASREEAERIVRGLNEVAKQLQKHNP